MCVVSMVGDYYYDKWRRDWPQTVPIAPNSPTPEVSRAEFDKLKKDVEEMKELLKRAKKYDEDNGEPDCEIEDKMAILRKVAEAVGVDLDDVIERKSNDKNA